MKFPKIPVGAFMKSIWTATKKHSPEILTGLGITGMVVAGVKAVKVTPKAMILLEEKKKELDKDKLNAKETIQAAGKCYIPSVAIAAMSAGCLIGANSVNLRRNAALATAYSLSETALREYKEKAIEMVGEKKEKAIREAVGKEQLERNPVREVILTEGGNTVCYDAISGRYFKSDKEKIARAVNELNRRMRNDLYVTLNDFYYEIGLEETKLGDMLGWNIDKGYLDITYSSHLDANGTPCLVLDYQVAPIYDFQ